MTGIHFVDLLLIVYSSLIIIIIIVFVIFYIYGKYFGKKEVKKDMPYKFEIFKDEKEEFRFRFVAPNGEIMLQSEGYTRKEKCLNAIDSIQRNSAEAEIKEVEK